MVERFRVVPAVYVVFRREAPGRPAAAEVLLQLRQHTGYMDGHWATAAAGHVEADESVFAAAVREVREELGVTVRTEDLVPLTAMHRTAGDGDSVNERVDFFLTTTAWQGEPSVREPDKCADLAWFALDALPDPVVPHEAEVFDRLRRGHVPAILAHGF